MKLSSQISLSKPKLQNFPIYGRLMSKFGVVIIMEIPLALDNRCQDGPQYSPQSQRVGEIEDNIYCVDGIFRCGR